jgi:hypothetical protein
MAQQENWQNRKEPDKGRGDTKEREPALTGGTVGKTEPDHSKEHNTEIAVEQGRKGREQH